MSNASVFPLDTNNFLKDIVGLYDSISQKTSFTFIDGDRLLINKDDKMKYEGNWDLKNDGILNIMIQDDSLKFRINRITSDSLKIFSEGHNSLRNVDLIFEKKK
ncbi:MAG TPA: hypothetical protein VD908_12955 [Cytophagales bacterium]|nr:hypothetical protein [Cytophagales bacterium]